MTSKKSIFEKLGLVEAVEDKTEQEANASEGFFLNPNDEELTAEFEAMLKEQAEVSNEESLGNTMEETAFLRNQASDEANQKEHLEESSLEIEDKLNVLIGAYEKNKMLSIEDIYKNARLFGDSKRSIFIADIFLKTLPENLPVGKLSTPTVSRLAPWPRCRHGANN